MRHTPVKMRTYKAGFATLLLATAAVGGCTDLTEVPASQISPDNYFKTPAEVLGGVAGVYATLRDNMWGYYNLSEVSTDEQVVPTRGSDWFDNGRWLEIHRQLWTPTSGSAGDDINGVWNNMWSGIAKANAVLAALRPNTVPDQPAIEAELRALRAYYYIGLMDFFGGVPIVTSTEIKPRERTTRDSVFKFVESELIAVRGALPTRRDAGQWGRMTQGAVDAMLVSIYLNAEVYTGTVTASGITKGTARWADVVTVADRLINAGTYTLASNYKSNFVATNQNSPENIFVVRFSTLGGLGSTLNSRSFHYNSSNFGGWNGFATVADVYNKFDRADARDGVWLVGPQVNLNTGAPALDRSGNRLIFTPEIKDVTQATEGEGVRLYKFPIDQSVTNENQPNDFPHYRLAEVYLSKAEAQNELGQTSAAIATANVVRARAFSPAKPLSTGLSQAAARAAIFDERLFELVGEAKRRQDMVRAGTYTAAFQFKTAQPGYKVLMPIPAGQLATNPLLKQNPGY
jgi:hypothetical protein